MSQCTPLSRLVVPTPLPLTETARALCDANADFLRGPRRRLGRRALPSRQALQDIVEGLKAALFPWHFGGGSISPDGVSFFVGHALETALSALEKQIRIGLLLECRHNDDHCDSCEERAAAIVQDFAAALVGIRELLGSDANAAVQGDPAANGLDEVIFCYPGMTAIIHHRIAHALHSLGARVIARIISELAHAQTGIDIHPGARIGRSFFVDHGTGVVIGETCTIGTGVRIYQGVTLGARHFPTDENGDLIRGARRHPTVEDNVVMFAGATILGCITIGQGSVIGGNVWVTRDVKAGSKVVASHSSSLRVSSPE